MILWLVAFFLILSRTTAFFLFLPVFGWQAIPVRIRVATIVLLSIFFSFQLPLAPSPGVWTMPRVYLLMVNEVTYGLALGVVVYSLFAVVRCAARIIERQMGFAMAEIMDPLTGERIQPLGGAVEMIFILIFLCANGHHALLIALDRSFQSYPLGTMPSIHTLTSAIVQSGSVMLVLSLRLAAPVLVAFLLMLVVLAIMARLVPEMNILFVSMPVRVGLGLLMAAMMLPFFQEYMNEFADLMNRLLPI